MLQVKLLNVKASSVKLVASRDQELPFQILQVKSANKAQGAGAFQIAIPHWAARHNNPSLHTGSSCPPAITRWSSLQRTASGLARAAGVHTWLVILVMKQSTIQVFPYRGNRSSEIRDLVCLGSITSQLLDNSNHFWGTKYLIDLEAR